MIVAYNITKYNRKWVDFKKPKGCDILVQLLNNYSTRDIGKNDFKVHVK